MNKKQEAFMQHIADRLGRARMTSPPPHPYRGAPVVQQNVSDAARVELFMANWEAVGGEAKQFNDREALRAFIIETAQRLSVRHIVQHDEPAINELQLGTALSDVRLQMFTERREDYLSDVAQAHMGIVCADFAVAETGSVVLKAMPGKGRAVSLLPAALMIIIRSETVVQRLGDAMALLNEAVRNMPAGIHFISGPSRSADIENDLTIGVHGPGIVYALIVP